MILRNLITADGRSIDLFFQGEKTARGEDFELALDRALVFPGLVNSHDHLDFNLFPQLGGEGFNNYTEWGHYIHEHYRQEIENVLKIPVHLRGLWGMYKNLICGVTTVVHHGDWLPFPSPVIRIFQEAQSLHSVQFEKYWKLRLNNPFRRNSICVIHAGEGKDKLASEEAGLILRWNFLQRELVAIHGISMTPEQSAQYRGLVWCPVSNDFLYQQTADIKNMRTRVVLGTDSTLTGSWNIWDHLDYAKQHYFIPDHSLLDMVTVHAGEVWGLEGYEQGNLPCDLVVAGIEEGRPFTSITPADILLVITKGKVRLIDENLMAQLKDCSKQFPGFSRIDVMGSTKLVEGNLPGLITQIRGYAPEISFPVSEKKTCIL